MEHAVEEKFKSLDTRPDGGDRSATPAQDSPRTGCIVCALPRMPVGVCSSTRTCTCVLIPVAALVSAAKTAA